MTPNEIQKLCKSLKPVLGEQAEALWLAYLAEDDKGKREFEEFLPLLSTKLLGKTLEDDKILLLPPTAENAAGEFLIGQVVYNKKVIMPLCLREEDLIHQVGIFSITGGGKTNLGMLLALHLLKRGTPCLIIDWKREYRQLLSLSANDHPELKGLRIYTIGRSVVPFQWNPFRGPPNVHWKTWLAVMAEVFERSHLGGPGVADYFLGIYEKVFSEFGFNSHDEKMCPNFFDGLKELAMSKVSGREFLWKQSTKRIFHSFVFGPHAGAFNARNPIKLEELLEQPVIFELDQELPKSLRIFFTEIILRFIHLYRLSQGETKRLRHLLCLEEIHNLFPNSRYEKDLPNSLENVFREIRAFGQGMVSITQHTSLLPLYILGNCHTQIMLALQHEDDIWASKKSIFLEKGEEVYFDRLKVGEGIVKVKGRINPCLVQFPLVPVKIGQIDDEAVKKHMEGYFADSSRNNPKNQVVTPVSIPDKISENEQKLLADVLKFPLCAVSIRYQQLGMNPRQGSACKDSLISKEFIEPMEIPTAKGRVLVLKLTPKACDYLKNRGYDVPADVNSIEHRFWKERVAYYYRQKGFIVEVEKISNGKPDITVRGGGKKMAIEIETGKSKPIQNILDRLKAGFDYVISVPTSDTAEKRIRERLKSMGLSDDKRVRIVSVKAF